MNNVALNIKIKTLEMTGMYERVNEIFFIKHLEICYVDVVLHGKKRRCKALHDSMTGLLEIQGMVGTFEHSDLRWPASVKLFESGDLEVRWGPHTYMIDTPMIENLAFK